MNERLHFFKWLKVESESSWEKLDLDHTIFGFQIQSGTCWNKGLTDQEIQSFEKDLDVQFPEDLKAFYRVMNGTDKPAINVYGNCGEPYAYMPVFYSYPRDLEAIKKQIQWVYDEFKVDLSYLRQNHISPIFPLYKHRCVLLEEKNNPVLSMYGKDVIPWATSIREYLLKEIFGDEMEEEDSEENKPDHYRSIRFWID